jgi:hypothetical protein
MLRLRSSFFVKARGTIALIILLAFIACLLMLNRRHDGPRRHSLQVVQNLGAAIDTNPPAILDEVVLPQSLASHTPAEQTEFLKKALRDEISADGIAALNRKASFGLLRELFPQEAVAWTKQAGVNPDHCVAFKMERAGIRAEVVLVQEGNSYRILRCNNVKQMAARN